MSIVETIAKLRAKAEDKSVTEEEASLFADKVAELLAKHNLNLDDIDREDNHIVEEHWHTVYCDPWRRYIAHSAARLYFCDCYYRKWYDPLSRRVRDGIVFVGSATNIFVAKEMSEYLFNTTMRMAIKYAHEHKDTNYSWRQTRLNYERGMGTRLAQRLRQLREARMQKQTGDKSGLPALYDTESVRAREHIDSLKLTKKVGFTSVFTRRSAAQAGFQDAEKVSLQAQVPGGVRDPGDPE